MAEEALFQDQFKIVVDLIKVVEDRVHQGAGQGFPGMSVKDVANLVAMYRLSKVGKDLFVSMILQSDRIMQDGDQLVPRISYLDVDVN